MLERTSAGLMYFCQRALTPKSQRALMHIWSVLELRCTPAMCCTVCAHHKSFQSDKAEQELPCKLACDSWMCRPIESPACFCVLKDKLPQCLPVDFPIRLEDASSKASDYPLVTCIVLSVAHESSTSWRAGNVCHRARCVSQASPSW